MTVHYSIHRTAPATKLDWDRHDLDRLPETTRKFLRDAGDRGVDLLLLDEIDFPKVVLASFAALSDYTSLDVANTRWADDYGQGTAVEMIGHYSQSWVFDPTLPPEPEVLDDILDVLDDYRESSIFDGDEWSEVQREWFDADVWEPFISRLPLDDDHKSALAADCWLDGRIYDDSEGYLDEGRFWALVGDRFGLTADDLTDN